MIRVLLGLMIAAAAPCQETYRIAGSVVNTQTGMPIRGALVQVQGTTNGRLDAANKFVELAHREVLTDSTGQFSAEVLPAGTYVVTAQKLGFARDNSGQASEIKVGPAKDGIVISLTPYGVITGRVVDGDGEAVPFASVRAVMSEIQDGARRYRQVRTVSTDDQGRYRLWNLQAGEYYIATAGRTGGTASVIGPSVTALSAPPEAFAPTYFPSSKDRGTATPIVLTAGQDVTADVHVTMEACFRVRGLLRGAAANQPLTVELLRDESDLNSTRAVVNAATGRFEVREAVPGSYLLRATQGSGESLIRGQQRIQVRKADISGVVIDLAPGIQVTGVIRRPAQSAQEFGAVGRPGGTPRTITASVTLTPADAASGSNPLNAQADGQGQFSFDGVTEGRYRLQVNPLTGYVASAAAGTQDLLHGDLTVVAGATPPRIEVDVRNDSATLTVTAPETRGAFLVVPDAGGAPAMVRVYGGPAVFHIAPGGYRVLWIKDEGSVEYRNPVVVNALRGGVSVRVNAGTTETVQLKEMAQ